MTEPDAAHEAVEAIKRAVDKLAADVSHFEGKASLRTQTAAALALGVAIAHLSAREYDLALARARAAIGHLAGLPAWPLAPLDPDDSSSK